jgi:hypothetical protein
MTVIANSRRSLQLLPTTATRPGGKQQAAGRSGGLSSCCEAVGRYRLSLMIILQNSIMSFS